MIKVTDSQGCLHLINPSQIVRVSEAGSSSKYNGTRSHIKLTDGVHLDCQQSVTQVQALIEAQANATAA